MHSIIVILPYFGRFPSYFRLWLSSCHYNETVDFLIVTDNDCSMYPPAKNVKFLTMPFNEFKAVVRGSFDFDISLDRPYKLCDFKPFYGKIFKDQVSSYDFWGYCDCDLIFGNIRKFATQEILSSCDKFLGHGHFSLYRRECSSLEYIINETKIDGKFDFRYVLSHPEIFVFDEYDYHGVSYSYQALRPDVFYSGSSHDDRVYDDIYSDVTPFRDIVKDGKNRKRSVVYLFRRGSLQRLIWENQALYCEETLYVHLMKRSMRTAVTSVDDFAIVPNAFITYPDHVTPAFVATYTDCYLDWRKLKTQFVMVRARMKIGARLRGAREFLR